MLESVNTYAALFSSLSRSDASASSWSSAARMRLFLRARLPHRRARPAAASWASGLRRYFHPRAGGPCTPFYQLTHYVHATGYDEIKKCRKIMICVDSEVQRSTS